MPPQALELVEMAVAECISRVVRVRICLKMVGYIKSVDLIAISFRVQWIFKPVVSVSSFRGSSWTPELSYTIDLGDYSSYLAALGLVAYVSR